jgi:tetratricopeptide (TPR) repeat protein
VPLSAAALERRFGGWGRMMRTAPVAPIRMHENVTRIRRTAQAWRCGAPCGLAGALLLCVAWGCDPPAVEPKANGVSDATQDASPALAPEPAPREAAQSEPAAADEPGQEPESRELRLPPEDDERTMQAWSMIVQGRNEEARELLARVIDEYPDCAQAVFFTGVSYQRQKDYERARAHLERVIELDVPFPSDETTYYFYGWSLYWLGELDAARAAFETHREGVPTEADTHFALGLIAFDEDKLDEAEADFKKAIELHDRMATEDPARYRQRLASVAKCHGRLADVYSRRGDLEEAKAELERAIELWPAHHQTYYKLYRVLLRLGEDEQAERALQTHQRILRQRGIIDGDDE